MGTIPNQVEEAAELAEQLHQKMFEEPEQTDIPQEDEGYTETEQQEPDDEESTYQARYKSLKGKYDKEVPRLHQELKELKENVFSQIYNLTAQQQQMAQQQYQQTPTEQEPDFLESFTETYGEDFTDNLRKLIAREAEKLTGYVEQKVQSVEEVQYQAAQNNFVNYIDSKLSDTKLDWRSCWSGNDPDFIEFLKQPDPSGLYTYGDLAEIYNKNWDADKLATIFHHYAQAQEQPEQNTRSFKPNTTQRQENLIAPSRTNSHSTPPSNNSRVWTQSMIKEFETADRQGKYTPEESTAMWNDILKALSENRIR